MTKTFFAHFRLVNMDTNEVSPTCGVTSFIELNDDLTFQSTHAVCNIKDTFYRKRGRTIAQGRFEANPSDRLNGQLTKDDESKLHEEIYNHAYYAYRSAYRTHPKTLIPLYTYDDAPNKSRFQLQRFYRKQRRASNGTI